VLPVLQGIDLTQVLIVLIVLITSLSVHEAAHAFAADRLGDSTARQLGRLSLNPAVHVDPIGTILFPLIAFLTNVPLIGWAKPVPVNQRFLKHPKRDFALIAAAGPASNLVMAGIGAVALAAARAAAGPGDIAAGAVMRPLAQLLLVFTYVNVLLAVFNMIPVPPLDGGNVLLGVLPDRPGRLVEQLRPYGILILYALMLTGVLSTLLGPVSNYLLYLLGI
jgi:Zn-dependent protease